MEKTPTGQVAYPEVGLSLELEEILRRHKRQEDWAKEQVEQPNSQVLVARAQPEEKTPVHPIGHPAVETHLYPWVLEK
jgi:hypothetical protein